MNDQRWTRLRTHMNERALDCLLITDPKHVGYLTEHARQTGVDQGQPVVVRQQRRVVNLS